MLPLNVHIKPKVVQQSSSNFNSSVLSIVWTMDMGLDSIVCHIGIFWTFNKFFIRIQYAFGSIASALLKFIFINIFCKVTNLCYGLLVINKFACAWIFKLFSFCMVWSTRKQNKKKHIICICIRIFETKEQKNNTQKIKDVLVVLLFAKTIECFMRINLRAHKITRKSLVYKPAYIQYLCV